MNTTATYAALTLAAAVTNNVGEESKRMKDSQSSLNDINDNVVKSLLPEKVQITIQNGMRDGFEDDELFLGSR